MAAVKYEKYEYNTNGYVPCLRLKKGLEGVIGRVDLYRDNDWFRAKDKDIGGFGLFSESSEWEESGIELPCMLEEFSNEQLQLLQANVKLYGETLPSDELWELRELERELRKKMGDSYRGKC